MTDGYQRRVQLSAALGSFAGADAYEHKTCIQAIKDQILIAKPGQVAVLDRFTRASLKIEEALTADGIEFYESLQAQPSNDDDTTKLPILNEAEACAVLEIILTNSQISNTINAPMCLLGYQYISYQLQYVRIDARDKAQFAEKINDWISNAVQAFAEFQQIESAEIGEYLNYDIFRYARFMSQFHQEYDGMLFLDIPSNLKFHKYMLANDPKKVKCNYQASLFLPQQEAAIETQYTLQYSINSSNVFMGQQLAHIGLFLNDTNQSILYRVCDAYRLLPNEDISIKNLQCEEKKEETIEVRKTILNIPITFIQDPNTSKFNQFDECVVRFETSTVFNEAYRMMETGETAPSLLDIQNLTEAYGLIAIYMHLKMVMLKIPIPNSSFDFKTLVNSWLEISNQNVFDYSLFQIIDSIKDTHEENENIIVDRIYEHLLTRKKKLTKITNDVKNFAFVESQLENEFKDQSMVQINPIHQTSYKLQGQFTLPRTDIYQLFDQLQVNVLIPYARLDKFVKVANNIELPSFRDASEAWNQIEEDSQVSKRKRRKETASKIDYTNTLVYYLCVDDTPKMFHKKLLDAKQFSPILIQFSSYTEDKSIFNITIELEDESIETNLLSKWIQSLTFSSQIDLQNVQFQRSFSEGVTIINNLTLSPQIFHDFGLNNLVVQNAVQFRERNTMYYVYKNMRFFLSDNFMGGSKFKLDCDLKLVDTSSSKIDYTETFNLVPNQKVWILRLSLPIERKSASSNPTIITLQMSNQLVARLQQTLQYIGAYTAAFTYQYYCYLTTGLPLFLKNTQLEPSKVDVSKLENLQAIKEAEDNVFVPGYKRFCSSYPSVSVWDERKEEEYKKLYGAMGYLKYPPDKPYLFYCPPKDKKQFYLGLKHNTLRNLQQYPFIPCCYLNEEDYGKAYREGKTFQQMKEEYDKTETKQSLITTNKVLIDRNVGKIDSSVPKLFSFLMLSDGQMNVLNGQQQYYRISGPQIGYQFAANHRVLNTLSLLLKPSSNDADDIQTTKNAIITNLLTIVQSGILKSTGLSIAQATQIIKNNEFMDPKTWLPALRLLFNVEIVLFYQDRAIFKEGTLMSENFERFRIQNHAQKLYKKTAFLFVHFGAENDNVTNPVTELIVKHTTLKGGFSNKVRDAIFDSCQKAFQTSSFQVQALFKLINKMYVTRHISFSLANNSYHAAGYQLYDSYYKTRAVTSYSNPVFSFFTDPINNLQCTKQNESTNQVTNVKDVGMAIDFFKTIIGDSTFKSVIKLIVNYDFSVQLYYVIGCSVEIKKNVVSMSDLAHLIQPVNVYVNIQEKRELSQTSKILRDNKIPFTIMNFQTDVYPIPVSTEVESFSNKYRRYQKIALLITNYAMWLFSRFVQQQNAREMSELVLQSFFTTQVVYAKQSIPYASLTNRLFSLQNTGFVFLQNGVHKLLISSELNVDEAHIIGKKVYFYLSKLIGSVSGRNILATFYQQPYIPNFYSYADEFSTSIDFTVYNSAEDYENTVTVLKNQYNVLTQLVPSNQSYFVQFPLTIDNKMNVFSLLAVPCSTLEQAILTYRYFQQYKYVISSDEFEELRGDLQQQMNYTDIIVYNSKFEEIMNTVVNGENIAIVGVHNWVQSENEEEIGYQSYFSLLPY